MIEGATRLSWQVLPEPILREWFDLPLTFTAEEGETLRRGHIPSMMEDRWFVFYENEWLIFCRSWTGAPIFGGHLVQTVDRTDLAECWVSRDPEYYSNRDLDSDKALLRDLIAFLLSEPSESTGS